MRSIKTITLATLGALALSSTAFAQDNTGDTASGKRFSVADITALVSVDFARAIKEPVPEDAVALKRWHADLSARPSAKA